MAGIKEEKKIYLVGIYCRLSKDDGTDNESASIATQKSILTDYVKKQGWHIAKTYVDDGYSGTNFQRPSFQNMIKDIESGLINCVITKDLSRLGRNYLDCGLYLEVFFPEHNVRYIAVNDGVDTLNKSAMDITPFRNILNEMYAADISVKIKSAYRARFQQGKFIGQTVFVCKFNSKRRRIDPSEIKNYMANNLPEYMLPSHIEVLKEFPLTANGKIDRNILRNHLDGMVNNELLMERAFGMIIGADTYKVGHTVEDELLKRAIKELGEKYGDNVSNEELVSLEGEFLPVSQCYGKLIKKTHAERLLELYNTLPATKGETSGYSKERLDTLYKVFCHSFSAVIMYDAGIYVGNALVLSCRNKNSSFLPVEPTDNERFWKEATVGNITSELIEGEHLTCMTGSYADKVAERILKEERL